MVSDVEPPTVFCPGDIFVHTDPGVCGATVNFSFGAIDNCTATAVANPASGTFFTPGIHVVNITATDASGNISFCDFKITVVDQEAPVISNCPANIVVSVITGCDSTINWTTPIATDNCSAVMTSNHSPSDVFSIGTTTVTYTALDAAGNVSFCSFNVVVRDLTIPVLTGCPGDTMVLGDPITGTAVVSWIEPVGSDNCFFTVNSNFHSGDVFPMGLTNVIYGVVDGSNNFSTCSFSVTVTNTTDIPKPVTQNVNVYPNPFSEGITISMDGIVDGETYYTLYTIDGKEVSIGKIYYKDTEIRAEAFASGVYVMEIYFADGTRLHRRIIKN